MLFKRLSSNRAITFI